MDENEKVPTPHDIVSLLAYVSDAIDPRLAPSERNDICEKIFEIDSELGFCLLIGFTAGLIDKLAEMSTMGREEFIESYLTITRKNMGMVDLGFIENLQGTED